MDNPQDLDGAVPAKENHVIAHGKTPQSGQILITLRAGAGKRDQRCATYFPEASNKSMRRGWFVPAGIVSGFAVLAKGPVGLLLPLGVVGFFLVSSRQLRVLFDRRMVWGGLAFGLVALPWYIWVANETKADFLRGFLGTHNLNRFLSPLENHRGPFYYYMAVLAVGFAPWSIFLALMGWYGTGDRARRDNAIGATDNRFPAVYRFLWCWILVYLVFFSLAATKLPNYILPIYAPLAVLTARFLDRWRRREIAPPGWLLGLSLSCLLLIGLATSLGLFVVGGRIDLAQLHGRQLLGLEAWAFLGAMPAFAAVAGWWCLRRKICTEMIAIMAIMSILFLGTLAAYGSIALDAFKAPRYLVEASGARDTRREIRVGCYEYFQPSLVFYCRREGECAGGAGVLAYPVAGVSFCSRVRVAIARTEGARLTSSESPALRPLPALRNCSGHKSMIA